MATGAWDSHDSVQYASFMPSQVPETTKLKMRAHFPLMLSVVLVVAGCATEIQQFPSQTPLLAPETKSRSAVLDRDVDVELQTSYRRLLRQGSRWMYVGNIPQGEVFKPVDDVFTVEGAHVHEAHLVISGGRLVGFYLPVEKAFAPLQSPPHILFAQ